MTNYTEQQAVPVAQQAMYLIRKGGYFYRPNAQGYTSDKAAAGRYTLAEAISYSHPNGANGPRDGIDYILADEPAALALPCKSGEGAGEDVSRLKYDAPQGTGRFELVDPEPANHHSALYLVDPNGAMFNISSWDEEGIDNARGEWMRDTLNAALSDRVAVPDADWAADWQGDTPSARADNLARPRSTLATVAAANDEGVEEALDRRVRIAAWNVAKKSGASDALGYAVVEAVVAEFAAIRLLSRGEGKARSEGWTEKGHEWLNAGAPLPTSRKDDAS